MSTAHLPDIREFCGEKLERLREPQVIGGWRYATDGRILVREPAIDEPDSPRPFGLDLAKAWARLPHQAAACVERLPEPPDAEIVVCDACAGTGKGRAVCPECDGTGHCTCHCGHAHDCQECDGTGRVDTHEPCTRCSGTGKRPSRPIAPLAGRMYCGNAWFKIHRLGGVAYDPQPSDDPLTPLGLVADGGREILWMPMPEERTEAAE